METSGGCKVGHWSPYKKETCRIPNVCYNGSLGTEDGKCRTPCKLVLTFNLHLCLPYGPLYPTHEDRRTEKEYRAFSKRVHEGELEEDVRETITNLD